MDITFHIRINSPHNHAESYRNGDLIDWTPALEMADLVLGEYIIRGVIANPRLSFLHVTGVPDGLNLDKIKAKIKPAGDLFRHRKYRIIADPFGTDRERTVTWADAKTRIRKKVMSDPDDRTQDDETGSITDGDLL